MPENHSLFSVGETDQLIAEPEEVLTLDVYRKVRPKPEFEVRSSRKLHRLTIYDDIPENIRCVLGNELVREIATPGIIVLSQVHNDTTYFSFNKFSEDRSERVSTLQAREAAFYIIGFLYEDI